MSFTTSEKHRIWRTICHSPASHSAQNGGSYILTLRATYFPERVITLWAAGTRTVCRARMREFLQQAQSYCDPDPPDKLWPHFVTKYELSTELTTISQFWLHVHNLKEKTVSPALRTFTWEVCVPREGSASPQFLKDT